MGRHRAGRTAGLLPRIGTMLRADGPVEPRGRLSGVPEEPSAGIPVTQAMAILERIADRRAQHVGVSLGFVDRIQLLP